MRTQPVLALAALCGFLCGAAGVPEEAEERVGPNEDPALIRFEGVQTFSPAQIRDALAWDPGYVLAAHPRAPRGAWLEKIRERLEAGYRLAGFPQAQVEVRYDAAAHAPGVRVSEGPRFTKGAVQVRGIQCLPPEEVVKYLTTPQPGRKGPWGPLSAPRGDAAEGPEAPLWGPGEPVSFEPRLQQALTQAVRGLLSDHGRFAPKLQIEFPPGAAKGTLDLLISVGDEGPAVVLSKVEVDGVKTNTREDVVKYLGLQAGRLLTRAAVEEVQRRLWASGRFVRQSVWVGQARLGGDPAPLCLELLELDGAPPLGERLNPEAEALLKLRDWLEAFPARGEDLVLASADRASSFRFRLVVSPAGGTLAELDSAQGAHLYSLAATPGECALCARVHEQKLVAPAPRGQLTLNLDLSVQTEEQEHGAARQKGGLQFGVLWRTQAPGEHAPPLGLRLDLAPAAFLLLSLRPDLTRTLEGNVLTLQSRGFTLRVDAQTGKLLELSQANAQGEREWELRFQAGALAQALAELRAATADHAEAFDTQHPAASVAAFLAAEALLAPSVHSNGAPAPPRAATLLRQRFALALAGLDALYVPPEETPPDRRFRLPPDPATEATLRQNPLVAFALPPLVLGRKFLPAGSWPLALIREAAFVLLRTPDYADEELRGVLQGPDTGPLGFWAAAELLRLVDERDARTFAAAGLDKLAPADFRRDARRLLAGGTVLGASALNVARALRALSGAELDLLLEAAPPASRATVRRALDAARDPREPDPGQAFLAALELLWRERWHDAVGARLTELAAPAKL